MTFVEPFDKMLMLALERGCKRLINRKLNVVSYINGAFIHTRKHIFKSDNRISYKSVAQGLYYIIKRIHYWSDLLIIRHL